MEKVKPFLTGNDRSQFRRILKIMKLTMCILLATTMMVSGSLYSQSTRLTLKMNSISFVDLFREIEKKSEFKFAYSSSNFDPNMIIQVDVNKKTLEEILNETLPVGVTYEVIDRYVIIRNGDENATKTESGQQGSISGKVVDESGKVLPGVSVVIKGTTRGTITDANGD